MNIINWFFSCFILLREVGSLENWKLTVMGLRANRRIHFIYPLGKQAVKPTFRARNKIAFLLNFGRSLTVRKSRFTIKLKASSSPISWHDAGARIVAPDLKGISTYRCSPGLSTLTGIFCSLTSFTCHSHSTSMFTLSFLSGRSPVITKEQAKCTQLRKCT